MAPGTAGAEGKSYAVVFDPLDGSRNVECNIPVGSIFGVYEHDEALGVLRPGRDLVAAGYVLYSSSCLLTDLDAPRAKILGSLKTNTRIS